MNKYRIGYLDDDEGQNITFNDKFKVDFEIVIIEIDAISVPYDIINEITQNDLELLVLDFRLDAKGKSFNAYEVLEEIRKWNSYFPVLVLTSHETEAFRQLDDVNIINGKDDYLDRVKEGKNLFVLKIEELIKNYKNKQDFTSKRLEELVEKKRTMGLSVAEENEYYEHYRFINEISPEKLLPSDLLDPKNISTLHDLLSSTKELLGQLKEEK